MNKIGFSEKLLRLRQKRKVTQEQVAAFVGVTKASVSKWENQQSLPDITLLPKLAAYFNVTIDELLGYEPQLSKEQIQKIYQELASGFASKPFDEAMNDCRKLVQQYYSCFAFLIQICVLWLNHFPIAETPEKQNQILEEARQLCEHILKECDNVAICSDAVSLNAVFMLQLGQAKEVIENLEESFMIKNLSLSTDTILIQAYQMTGEKEKAVSFTQISMYVRLMELIGSALQYLQVNIDNLSVCEETIKRVHLLTEAYHLFTLHPNMMAQVEYQIALVYVVHGLEDQAIEHLEQFVLLVLNLFKDLQLHGDEYFNKLDEWIEKQDLGKTLPRDKRLVARETAQILSCPQFASLESREDFRRLKNKLQEGLKNE